MLLHWPELYHFLDDISSSLITFLTGMKAFLDSKGVAEKEK